MEYVSADAPKKRNRFMRKDYSRVVTGNLEDQLKKAKKDQSERLRLINGLEE